MISFFKKHTSHSNTLIFLAGFIFDIIMLPNLEDPRARYIGFGHLCIVGFFIMFREWIISRNTASDFERSVYKVSTFMISLSSGAALSFIFVYALRSAALTISWPLLLILAGCIITNELVSNHNFRLTLDVGVLFIAIIFFSIFNAPLLFKMQNDMIFASSIIIAMIVCFIYIYILNFTSESAEEESSRGYALAIGIPMFVAMLYFLNIIPAVPLSLKEGGVFHNIIRTDAGEFVGDGEVDNRILAKFYTPIYHITPSDTGVYFFSAVNAPAELTAPLSHVWEYYDQNLKKWTLSTTIPFTISGGRDNGYRAYSYKENIPAGTWRVTVKVGGSRIVGQVKFNVIKTNNSINIKKVDL